MNEQIIVSMSNGSERKMTIINIDYKPTKAQILNALRNGIILQPQYSKFINGDN